MPTANEKKALLFFATVALSGSAVRVCRSTASHATLAAESKGREREEIRDELRTAFMTDLKHSDRIEGLLHQAITSQRSLEAKRRIEALLAKAAAATPALRANGAS